MLPLCWNQNQPCVLQVCFIAPLVRDNSGRNTLCAQQPRKIPWKLIKIRAGLKQIEIFKIPQWNPFSKTVSIWMADPFSFCYHKPSFFWISVHSNVISVELEEIIFPFKVGRLTVSMSVCVAAAGLSLCVCVSTCSEDTFRPKVYVEIRQATRSEEKGVACYTRKEMRHNFVQIGIEMKKFSLRCVPQYKLKNKSFWKRNRL